MLPADDGLRVQRPENIHRHIAFGNHTLYASYLSDVGGFLAEFEWSDLGRNYFLHIVERFIIVIVKELRILGKGKGTKYKI